MAQASVSSRSRTALVQVAQEAAVLDGRLAALDGAEAAETGVIGFADLALRFRRELKVLFDNTADVAALPGVGVEGIEEFLETKMIAYPVAAA